MYTARSSCVCVTSFAARSSEISAPRGRCLFVSMMLGLTRAIYSKTPKVGHIDDVVLVGLAPHEYNLPALEAQAVP